MSTHAVPELPLVGLNELVTLDRWTLERRARALARPLYLGDGVWNARGPDADVGAKVRVVGAEGTCLKVEPLGLPHSSAIG